MAKLKPAFGDREKGTMTAGNSTPLSDGAATALVASDEWAEERSLPVLAHVVDAETAAVDFVHGDEGLLAAPLYTVPRLLDRNGLSLRDFDLYEIHEAFASQVLMTLMAWADPAFCKDRARRGGDLAWVGRSTYLRRGKDGEGQGGSEDLPALATSAVWPVPADIGRRYARVSGDRNPIHVNPLAARLFGFPRRIAHGMWMKARCLAAFEGRLPEAFAVEVEFRRPLTIPGKAAFGSDEGRFVLATPDGRKPHVVGAIE